MVYKISDNVWHRVVQIVQEAMLLGVDIADLLRMVRVEVDPKDDGQLVLTEEYKQHVIAYHKQLLDQAEHLAAVADEAKDEKEGSGSGGGQAN